MTVRTQKNATPKSALLSFRAGNVRSFREEFELSLVAGSRAEAAVCRQVPWRGDGAAVDVLPAAGIFGANASGKSNVLFAMSDMRGLVLNSFRRQRPTSKIPRAPFRLASSSSQAPTSFEIDLVADGVRYQYGFTISDERVLDEWAVHFPNGRSALLFSREVDDVSFGKSTRSRGRDVERMLRPNALFLSTAAAVMHPTLMPIYSWFESNLLLAEAESRSARQTLTVQMLEDETRRAQVLNLLREADLGLRGAIVEEIDDEQRAFMQRVVEVLNDGPGGPSEEPIQIEPMANIVLQHQGANGPVQFTQREESLGTLVWFGLIGPVLLTLRTGGVLLADELDASLHPLLVARLIELFQDPDANPNLAQLIFNAHDTTALGRSTVSHPMEDRLLSRDQIWFTEKLDDGASRLYPLSDFAPRKADAIEQRYLAGRYGAVPAISGSALRAAVGVGDE